MAQNSSPIDQAEHLIRAALEKHFNQKIDKDALRAAAQKMASIVPQTDGTKKAA